MRKMQQKKLQNKNQNLVFRIEILSYLCFQPSHDNTSSIRLVSNQTKSD